MTKNLTFNVLCTIGDHGAVTNQLVIWKYFSREQENMFIGRESSETPAPKSAADRFLIAAPELKLEGLIRSASGAFARTMRRCSKPALKMANGPLFWAWLFSMATFLLITE